MLIQNESRKRMDYSKFAFLKNQDGGGRHLEYQLNCDIAATTWLISTKFGILTRVGTPLAVQRASVTRGTTGGSRGNPTG